MKILLPLIVLVTIAATAHADAVRMKIIGPDGKPLAGALVRVQEWSGRYIEPDYEAPRDLVSDANGVVNWESKFSLAHKPDDGSGRGNQALARVEAPGVAAMGGAVLDAGENVITLAKAMTMEGVVRDENQRPIAGARVRITQLFWPPADENADDGQTASLQGALTLETVADAQGRWRLENMPTGALARFEVTAPGFRKLKFSTPIVTGAPPIFLRRGATVKGRILRPDGTGAANVQFFAGDAWNQPRTDAQGRFEVDGIKPGRVTLQIPIDAARLPFILANKPVQGLVAGEVRDVGDWKADKGVRVRGRVVDGAGKPIANASVMVWGAGNGDGQTDGKGAFDFVAQKGASMSMVYADGYIAKRSPDVPEATGGIIDLGEIMLRRGQKITGVTKNQAGALVPYVRLQAMRNGNELGAAYADAKGEFTFEGLEDGPYKIQSYGGKIIAGERFTLPATGTLNVVVEGRAPVGKTNKSLLQTRVVDENGVGVAGAQIALQLETGPNSFSDYSAISDAEGALHENILGASGDLKVTEVFRPGYSAGASDLQLHNGVWSGEIRLQSRGQFLRGRVVDSDDKPLGGIAVALNRGFDLPVTTDENGEFTLSDAPQTGVKVLASDGARFASFAVAKIGQKIEIALPVADAPVDNASLADEIAPRAWWDQNLFNDSDNWERFGAARMESIALGMNGDAEQLGRWNQFLLELARREPARFLASESELRAQNAPDNDEGFEFLKRMALAVAGDEAQKTEMRDWLASEQKIKRETNTESVFQLLACAEVASRLGDGKGTQLWLDYAAQIGDYVPGRSKFAWLWADNLAHIGPDAATKFVENWPPTEQIQLLTSALRASIRRNDADAVHADWEQIQKMVVAVETSPPDKKTRAAGFTSRPSELLPQSRSEYAQFLSRTDPQAAFELVKETTPDDYFRALAMPVIGKNAAKLGQFNLASLALKAGYQSNLTNFGADAAQIAATFDDQLAAELFARSYNSSRPNGGADASQFSLGNYAAARADKWPGETRVLAAREWPIRLEDAAKPRDPDNRDSDLGDELTVALVGAMARVALARAVEMSQQLPERKHLRAKAFAALLSALLAK